MTAGRAAAPIRATLQLFPNSSMLSVAMATLFKIRRVWRRGISAGAAMALLCAQLGVAAYACPDLSTTSAVGAISMTEHCAQGGSVVDPQYPAVCHEQCKPQANVDYRLQGPDLPPAVPTRIIVTWVDPYPVLSRARLAEPDAPRANGPPLSILFCVSRT
jgi:hypothetical protein